MNDILSLEREDIPGKETKLPCVQTWKAEGITFRYGNGLPVLENVSIAINRGEKIALIGSSGSGKSTLAKLFLRFYRQEKGIISADGSPIDDYGLSEIRKGISYVNQELFVFADTIEKNIRFGNKDATGEELRAVCSEAGLDDFIKSMPLGLETMLEEGGSNISRGQLQRIIIARALLRKPQLLILDEATSSLDPVTSSEITKNLYNIPDLTCLIISHHLDLIKNCDRIYVMDQGKIAESGTHDELLTKRGKYFRLWNARH